MSFLVVFICCAVELNHASFAPFRGGQWIGSWHTWLADELGFRRWFGRGSLLISLAIPCGLAGYIFSYVLDESTVLTFLGATALLLFCSGPGDLARDLESYTRNYLDEEGDQPPTDKANFLNNVNANDADPDRPYMRAIALEANERLFAPMFWFSILGPVGVLLFCMSRGLKHGNDLTAAEADIEERLYNILVWIPARLLGFGLGLAGTLGPVMRTLAEHDYDLSQSGALLGDVLIAALDRHEYDDLDDGDEHVASINAAFGLVKSGFVVWLVVLALLAAAGLA